VYLLGVDSLRIVQPRIALIGSGFIGRTLNVFIVFSRLRTTERALQTLI
jgi:hypothetical protein